MSFYLTISILSLLIAGGSILFGATKAFRKTKENFPFRIFSLAFIFLGVQITLVGIRHIFLGFSFFKIDILLHYIGQAFFLAPFFPLGTYFVSSLLIKENKFLKRGIDILVIFLCLLFIFFVLKEGVFSGELKGPSYSSEWGTEYTLDPFSKKIMLCLVFFPYSLTIISLSREILRKVRKKGYNSLRFWSLFSISLLIFGAGDEFGLKDWQLLICRGVYFLIGIIIYISFKKFYDRENL